MEVHGPLKPSPTLTWPNAVMDGPTRNDLSGISIPDRTEESIFSVVRFLQNALAAVLYDAPPCNVFLPYLVNGEVRC